ncbi:DNA cytosine methyltransferase [Streptomyces sp. NPDC094472]|uniref:DNA cytosine methyltransferase n=1 Tax=Streptomyces sp. NPDC094472 TaxID=3155080 RepID=UPI0033250682
MPSADVLIGSLCSGVGGLDLGVQTALGGHIAWHAETDPQANQVLARHWQAPNLGDVQAIDWHRVRPVCVLTAGFPCQDLSVAGPRTGLAPGTRSGLWHHVVTAIETLSPCLVVIENVRGLLSTRAGSHPLRHMEPARGVWETQPINPACGHWACYSRTWPTSGTTRAGHAYAPLTSEPRTAARESVSH